MSRYRIQIELWPRGSWFEGKRLCTGHQPPPCGILKYDLEIAEAELLAAQWARASSKFEQEAAQSINCALREREEDMNEEETVLPGIRISRLDIKLRERISAKAAKLRTNRKENRAHGER